MLLRNMIKLYSGSASPIAVKEWIRMRFNLKFSRIYIAKYSNIC